MKFDMNVIHIVFFLLDFMYFEIKVLYVTASFVDKAIMIII